MELVDYLRLIRRRLAYIVLAIVAGGLGGYAVARNQTSTYSSTLRLFVSTSAVNPAGLFDSISQVADSEPVLAQAEAVARARQGAGVEAAEQGQASVIAVTVTSSDPKTAMSVAAAYATVLPAAYAKLDKVSQLTLQTLDQSPPIGSELHKNRILGLGLALGLVAGLAAALLREALDRSIRDPDDLSDQLMLPLRGLIPADRVSSGIVSISRPRSARAEAYRRLGAAIRLSPGNTGSLRTVLITSALAREGKTTTVLNLAAAASGSGEAVLVIDADLRRPSVHSVLGLENEHGLADILAKRVSVATALSHEGPGFDVITSGTTVANPVELLRGRELDLVLQKLSENYDLILIDAPAALGVADAQVLGSLCDSVLFVSRLGATPRGRSKAAVETLSNGGSRVWGVVGTFAPASDPLPKPLRGAHRGGSDNLLTDEDDEHDDAATSEAAQDVTAADAGHHFANETPHAAASIKPEQRRPIDPNNSVVTSENGDVRPNAGPSKATAVDEPS